MKLTIWRMSICSLHPVVVDAIHFTAMFVEQIEAAGRRLPSPPCFAFCATPPPPPRPPCTSSASEYMRTWPPGHEKGAFR